MGKPSSYTATVPGSKSSIHLGDALGVDLRSNPRYEPDDPSVSFSGSAIVLSPTTIYRLGYEHSLPIEP